MRGILADINVVAHVQILVRICNSDYWRELWADLGLDVEDFPGLGLDDAESDAVIWRQCQQEKLVLITGNRNRHGPGSLQAVIEAENRADSLPVITIADMDRVLRDRTYAELAAESLLGKLIAIDSFCGTGRVYLP